MDGQHSSYLISSLTTGELNEKFLQAKKEFGLLYSPEKTPAETYLLKNVPHITLKNVFYLLDQNKEAEIRDALVQVTFPSIQISASNLHVFQTKDHGNVLVVLVDTNPTLQKLHMDIYQAIHHFAVQDNGKFEQEVFNPHLSVFYNLPEERIDEAKAYVTSHILPITYELTSFLFTRDIIGVKNERSLIKEYHSRK